MDAKLVQERLKVEVDKDIQDLIGMDEAKVVFQAAKAKVPMPGEISTYNEFPFFHKSGSKLCTNVPRSRSGMLRKQAIRAL